MGQPRLPSGKALGTEQYKIPTEVFSLLYKKAREKAVKKRRSQKNYLEFIPAVNPNMPWEVKDDGIVVVTVAHKGIFDKVAQKLFHKPPKSYISLDKFGSFIWQQIDGQRNVFAIAELVSEEFGEEANPLYERLIKFFEILKENKYITLQEVEPHA